VQGPTGQGSRPVGLSWRLQAQAVRPLAAQSWLQASACLAVGHPQVWVACDCDGL